MGIRKLLVIASLGFAFAAKPARAEVGLGIFVGEPTGVDVKLDLARRSALDFVLGVYSHWDHYNTDGAYGHMTYLVQPMVGHGDSVLVPLRLGIGFAVFDDYDRFRDDINVAARVPFEVGLRFRRTPLEIYFEIALKMTFIDENDNHPFVDLDGGIGLRFYL
ncbi:MAG TPA: hypothetical protein VFV99_10445 [Kofleriaceae bacterium]|nr:hypothetical protein [Kofleriaceae bacterium]